MSRKTFQLVRCRWSSRSGESPAPRIWRRDPRRLRPSCWRLEDRRLLATLTVMNTASSGTGSLAAAIATANGNNQANSIEFSATAFSTLQTISLDGSELELSDTSGFQTITGPAVGVTISGGGTSRVFQVDNGVTAALSGLTITDGEISANSSSGAGLYNSGTTTLTNCTISANSAPRGLGGGLDDGGPDASGTSSLTLMNCTITANSALNGGGLGNSVVGPHGAPKSLTKANLALTDCTISGNSAGAPAAAWTIRHGDPDRLHHQRKLGNGRRLRWRPGQ